MQPLSASLLGKGQTLRYAGRPASASPAVGYHSVHEKEQEELVDYRLLIDNKGNRNGNRS